MTLQIKESLYNIWALSKILVKLTITGILPSGAKGVKRASPAAVKSASPAAPPAAFQPDGKSGDATGDATGDANGDAAPGASASAAHIATPNTAHVDAPPVDAPAPAAPPRKPGGFRVNSQMLLAAVIVICVAPSIGFLCVIAWQFITAAVALKIDHILIGLYLSAIALISFTLALFQLFGVFYMDKNTDKLLPLPLRPYEILFAKFISVLAFETLMQVFFLLPVLIIYGVIAGTPAYWLYAAVFYFLFPAAPTALASAVTFLLKPLIVRIKNTDVLSSVLNIAILVIICSVSLFSSRASTLVGLSQARIMQLLVDGDAAAFGFISRVMPVIRFSALAFARSGGIAGFMYFLLFIIFTAAFVAGFALLGRLFFASGPASPELTRGAARKPFDAAMIKTTRSSVMAQYVMKEIRILIRTPAYLMNCVSASLIFPVIIIVMLTVNAGAGGNDSAAFAALINGALSFLKTGGMIRYLPHTLGIGCAAGLLLGSMSSIAATAVSREGADFETNKYVPLEYRQIMWGKIAPIFILGTCEILIIFIYAAVVLGFPIKYMAAALPAFLAGLAQQGFTGLSIDLAMPKLNWESETAAVKRNVNVMINMAVSWALCALCIMAPILLAPHVNAGAASLLTGALIAALTALAWMIAARVAGPRCFRAI